MQDDYLSKDGKKITKPLKRKEKMEFQEKPKAPIYICQAFFGELQQGIDPLNCNIKYLPAHSR